MVQKRNQFSKETLVKYLALPDTGGGAFGAFGATYVLWILPLKETKFSENILQQICSFVQINCGARFVCQWSRFFTVYVEIVDFVYCN
jgi:hypothetical protein